MRFLTAILLGLMPTLSLATNPTITNIYVDGITQSDATVHWTTDINADSTISLKDSTYANICILRLGGSTTSHVFNINQLICSGQLSAGTVYYVQVASSDPFHGDPNNPCSSIVPGTDCATVFSTQPGPPTATFSVSPTPTKTNSPTFSPTRTASPTRTFSPTKTRTVTPNWTRTGSPTRTGTPTRTATVTPTPSPSATPTATP